MIVVPDWLYGLMLSPIPWWLATIAAWRLCGERLADRIDQ